VTVVASRLVGMAMLPGLAALDGVERQGSGEEQRQAIVEILEAYDLTGSFHARGRAGRLRPSHGGPVRLRAAGCVRARCG